MSSSLYKKLLDLQKAVRGLGKDSKGSSYKYVSGSKVLDAVRPKMDELGLLLVQQIDGIETERMDYSVGSGTQSRQKSEMFTKVAMTFTWIDCESGETLPVKFGATGQNGWDKGLGSALTYAERYFLLKFFHIATDEDDVDARPDEEAKPLPARDADGWQQPEKFPKPGKKQSPEKKPLEKDSRAWNSAVRRVSKGEPGLMDKLRAAYIWDEQAEADFADAVFSYNLDNRDNDGKHI